MSYPPKTPDKPFRCDVCHETFSFDGIHHGEIRDGNRESWTFYVCKNCNGKRYKPCHLCGMEILPMDADAYSNGQRVHLGCLHDISCPNEENERL